MHRTTAAKAFKHYGLAVRWRTTRSVMPLTDEVKKERFDICAKWKYLPVDHFVKNVDFIMDNKQWDIPTSGKARKHLQKFKVRGHLRTAQEGMLPEFVKPSRQKHRINPGAFVNVCAGISNGKVVLWEYLKGPWSGKSAAASYKGPIMKALRKHVGHKRSYTIMEDNDPKGYIL